MSINYQGPFPGAPRDDYGRAWGRGRHLGQGEDWSVDVDGAEGGRGGARERHGRRPRLRRERRG